jgi:carotenoid cleavage dioxygenase
MLPYREPDYGARVGSPATRESGDATRWCEVDPFVYHPMNAYDLPDGRAVCDVTHPKMFDTDRNGPNEGSPSLVRYRSRRRA